MPKTTVILSSPLIIGGKPVQMNPITLQRAMELAENATNFCRHDTVKLLGLVPEDAEFDCTGYDQAIVIKPRERLAFGKEYTVREISAIGYDIFLIEVVDPYAEFNEVLELAAKLKRHQPGKSDVGLAVDRNAPAKLMAEYQELLEELEKGDVMGAKKEAADMGYYSIKCMALAAALVDASIPDVVDMTLAKYRSRAAVGKNDAAESIAVSKSGISMRSAYSVMMRVDYFTRTLTLDEIDVLQAAVVSKLRLYLDNKGEQYAIDDEVREVAERLIVKPFHDYSLDSAAWMKSDAYRSCALLESVESFTKVENARSAPDSAKTRRNKLVVDTLESFFTASQESLKHASAEWFEVNPLI